MLIFGMHMLYGSISVKMIDKIFVLIQNDEYSRYHIIFCKTEKKWVFVLLFHKNEDGCGAHSIFLGKFASCPSNDLFKLAPNFTFRRRHVQTKFTFAVSSIGLIGGKNKSCSLTASRFIR